MHFSHRLIFQFLLLERGTCLLSSPRPLLLAQWLVQKTAQYLFVEWKKIIISCSFLRQFTGKAPMSWGVGRPKAWTTWSPLLFPLKRQGNPWAEDIGSPSPCLSATLPQGARCQQIWWGLGSYVERERKRKSLKPNSMKLKGHQGPFLP